MRDLHDGAQQRLVHTVVTLKLSQRSVRQEDGKVESLIGEALENTQRGTVELRELAHRILPALLTSGGLKAGIDAFVARIELPVQVEVPVERFAAEIAASGYFIVAEALTNVVKPAHAGRAEVRAYVDNDVLRIEVRDDGVGGPIRRVTGGWESVTGRPPSAGGWRSRARPDAARSHPPRCRS